MACATLAAVITVAAFAGTRAKADDAFREIETKYIFGFTTGSGVGLEGEKEITTDTITALGKRNGQYRASETKLEYEFTPSQYVQFEVGALLASNHISGVTGLDDRDLVAVSGGFGELRYLAIERGPASPFAVTLSVEPAMRRFSESSGDREHSFELETKIAADTELVPNRVYLGFNAFYEPEWVRLPGGDSERESTVGLSAALAFRPISPLVVGAEVGYFRHYDSTNLDKYVGDALYVGPTLYLKTSRKTFVTAAWATQVAGQSTEEAGSLNLADFSRHRGKLKFALEF